MEKFLLNLALDASEREREKSLELSIGYDQEEKTWEVIVKYTGSLDVLREQGIEVVELLNGYDEEETRRRKSPSRNHVRDILVASTLRSRKIAAHSANCSGCSVVNRRSEPPRPIRSSISA